VLSLGELAVRFGCELRGDPDAQVSRVSSLGKAQTGSVSFLANPAYRQQLRTTAATVVVLDAAALPECPVAALMSGNPYATYARIAQLLHPPLAVAAHRDPTAQIAADAAIHPSAYIGPFAVIGPGCQIAERVHVGPHCILEQGVSLGIDTCLVARVTVGARVSIGARTLIQPGVVIGADGFGFAKEAHVWIKVPQLGTVRVGADVEIGANTTIDRGAIDDTVIEDGVKLDNQIQVGHNVRIGAHTAIAACVGISGSTSIGQRCMIAGAVGITGHLTVTDDVVITGLSMVTHSITAAGVYSGGIPVEEASNWRRIVARLKRIDLLAQRVKRLERSMTGNVTHD
jgi:UDP-3-O-[3-hydroxymyristoyl] glucosamine N-acyltransferase